MHTAIEQKFSELKKRGGAALVCYLTAGDPSLQMTEEIAVRMASSGADMLEIGIPFSDPMADGPVIQRACERALESGATLEKILKTVRKIRDRSDIPIILFGYYNPFYRYGIARLAADAKAAGADGILTVDLPPEEAVEFNATLKEKGLDEIFLLSPNTTDERIEAVAQLAGGFIYLVSITGVTGERPEMDYGRVKGLVEKIRSKAGLPVGVGFGISTPEQAGRVASFADAVVVGSSIMRMVEESSADAAALDKIADFVSSLSKACGSGSGS
ncbi:tryptophan synthase subunit alpha [Candidatus Mycalebacterium sp.]